MAAAPLSLEATISLRTLNQHSGRIVHAVVDSGRAVTITDRGRPVARLVPIDTDETPLERLVREGKVRVPTRQGHFVPTVHPLPEGVSLESLLAEDREELS
ncbi:type II toxin-antitoxin system Phd/YefM family antitoxin [Schaalia cardiffensis]|uniref:type II toxin-antitoxin system Phd/YefM family antitoxin n=1 Tax=Schaalia cardiffensis TaxID=181487 RepID=UPI0023F280A4|nr:type II toxin-antitoxin system prevent-host-death family antitoxin [Schaalia cardiffensis]